MEERLTNTFIKDKEMEEVVRKQLRFIGEDPERDGLAETPKRVVESWKELFSGYNDDPSTLFKTFDIDEAQNYNQMVLLTNIQVYSFCEHHLLPFYGKAHVAYIPDDMIIGVSKLARLVEMFARRVQIQERIGEQVTNALMDHLSPKGAACTIKAVHLCMRMRGCSEQDSIMVTSSLKGAFRENQDTRSEFLQLIDISGNGGVL